MARHPEREATLSHTLTGPTPDSVGPTDNISREGAGICNGRRTRRNLAGWKNAWPADEDNKIWKPPFFGARRKCPRERGRGGVRGRPRPPEQSSNIR